MYIWQYLELCLKWLSVFVVIPWNTSEKLSSSLKHKIIFCVCVYSQGFNPILHTFKVITLPLNCISMPLHPKCLLIFILFWFGEHTKQCQDLLLGLHSGSFFSGALITIWDQYGMKPSCPGWKASALNAILSLAFNLFKKDLFVFVIEYLHSIQSQTLFTLSCTLSFPPFIFSFLFFHFLLHLGIFFMSMLLLSSLV